MKSENNTIFGDDTAMTTPAANRSDGGEAVTLALEGRITAYTAAPLWRQALETLTRHPDDPIRIDASRLEYIDNAGIALLFDLQHRPRPPQRTARPGA